MQEVDIWSVYDNINDASELIAFGGKNIRLRIKNEVKFEKLRNYE